jgi:hypothetical protein
MAFSQAGYTNEQRPLLDGAATPTFFAASRSIYTAHNRKQPLTLTLILSLTADTLGNGKAHV